MKSTRQGCRTTVPVAAEETPKLPPWRAFVVQFSRESNPQGEVAGRIEHLSSGHRARFESRAELLSVLMRMLDELGEASGKL